MARKKHEEEHENAERWLLTYADLITLLLAFFVVMYSMSRVDSTKWGRVSVALHYVLGLGDKGFPQRSRSFIPGAQEQLGAFISVGQGRALTTVAEELERKVEEQGLASSIAVLSDERGISIRFVDRILFDVGRAEIRQQAKPMLSRMAELLRGLPHQIQVEGHTDTTPINTRQYPSNWELSTGRASAIARYLIEQHGLDPARVGASGYSEHRPVASNSTDDGRARNRRVDIVILREPEDTSGSPGAPVGSGQPPRGPEAGHGR
ncbi:MAG: OmpA family protein [Deltaproteobacteria bacterium]|nr:OmpA family protein [Deltaproteobacteria bacterium]MBI3075653.1 OmpA family protein [Deltaproteobacteria bacterium]